MVTERGRPRVKKISPKSITFLIFFLLVMFFLSGTVRLVSLFSQLSLFPLFTRGSSSYASCLATRHTLSTHSLFPLLTSLRVKRGERKCNGSEPRWMKSDGERVKGERHHMYFIQGGPVVTVRFGCSHVRWDPSPTTDYGNRRNEPNTWLPSLLFDDIFLPLDPPLGSDSRWHRLPPYGVNLPIWSIISY